MIQFAYPAKLNPIVTQKARYKVAKGGRGSGKSWTVARHLLLEAVSTRQRVLCAREMQNSIRDSVHRLLVDQIYALGLKKYFIVQKDALLSSTGSEFLFKGLRHNISEIKSTEGITRCWIEEAEKVSRESWQTLIPTVRKEDSEFYIVYNPEDENSATNQKFGSQEKAPPGTVIVDINYPDNPWFPKVLRDEMEYDKLIDFEKYEHVWLGKFKKYAQALIFKNKFVKEEFHTPSGVQFFFGADWGFSNDPTVLLRMWIRDKKLYIDYEFYAIGVEINELERCFDQVPESRKWEIIADNARPETISYLLNKGFNIVGAEKGKGSVEDGIEFLKGFEQIIIHPRCPHTFDDFNNYKWKTDKITESILPIPADGSDHSPDAARYGLEKYIKSDVSIFEILNRR